MSSKFTQILEKIFGRKEEGQEKEQQKNNKNLKLNRKILYKDLNDFIKKKQEEDENATKEKAKPLIDECLRSIENMKNIVEEIKNEEININNRVKRIVQTNKEMFVKIMENVLNTEIDKDAKISEIKAKIFKIAHACGEMDIQYGRYVSMAHSQMENFRKNLKILVANAMDLGKMNFGEKYKILDDEYKILDDKYNAYLNEKKKAAEIKNLLMELERELFTNTQNLKELKNSEKAKLMNAALDEQSKIFAEKDRIETSIYSKISSIGRILKKIRRKNNIPEISLYIDNPRIFLERDNKELLNFLKLPGDLNKEEEEKILSFEKNFSILVEEKRKYKEILEKEKEIDEYIKRCNVGDEIKRIETRIADINIKTEQNKKDAERVEKNIQNIQIEISEVKKRLENKLNVEIEMVL